MGRLRPRSRCTSWIWRTERRPRGARKPTCEGWPRRNQPASRRGRETPECNANEFDGVSVYSDLQSLACPGQCAPSTKKIALDGTWRRITVIIRAIGKRMLRPVCGVGSVLSVVRCINTHLGLLDMWSSISNRTRLSCSVEILPMLRSCAQHNVRRKDRSMRGLVPHCS